MSLLGSLTNSPLVGVQRPRIENIPPGESLGDLAVRFSRFCGLSLDPWQEYVIVNSLRESMPGRWSAPQVGLVVPRQQGKGSILEARELFGLFQLPEERLIIHSAHLFKTAQEAFLRLMHWIETNPELEKRVKKVTTAHGSEGIELKDGSRIRFMARSGGSGRGFSADCIVLDEAYDLSENEMAAMLPTMAAKSMTGNPQMIYTSSAGMPESVVLEQVRRRGVEGDPRLAYFEWSAPDDADPDDVEAVRMANPGLGIRMSYEHVLNERAALGEEEFKRERLGIWAKLGGESFIPSDKWAKAVTPPDDFAKATEGLRVAFSVDVPPERDRATIGAAWVDDDGVVYVEEVDALDDLTMLPDALATLQGLHHPVTTVIDAGGAAAVLLKDLRRAKVKLTQIQARAYGQACGAFYDSVAQGKLRHPGQDKMNRAVDAARQTMMGETLWKWSRKDVEADISPLVAVTLAVHGVNSRNKVSSKRRVVVA